MVQIDREKCVGCGLCAADCLALNIEITDGKAAVKGPCIRCGHCVAICPAAAVSLPEYDMADVEACLPTDLMPDAETLLRLIKTRRSIRSYHPQRLTGEELHLLAQAGRYTATAKNNQGCHFVFVQDGLEELKSRIWHFIDEKVQAAEGDLPPEWQPFAAQNARKKTDPADDFLFRNAPAVLYITSEWPLDAGLAAQNIETMAASMGLGALYNGYLARVTDLCDEAKQWMGIEGKTVKACLLLGHPAVQYVRTAPRREAMIILK